MMCLSTSTSAAGNNRKSNIKSHGTLEYVGDNGESVYMQSLDLYNLADEIDSLETSYKTTLKTAVRNEGVSPTSSDVWSTILTNIHDVYVKGYNDGKKDTTVTKKFLSLFYNHKEVEVTYDLNDVTGKGYYTHCSGSGDTKGALITLQSVNIPLYDLSDENNPKLLYQIKHYFHAESEVGNGDSGSVGGKIELCDKNGTVIYSEANSRAKNGTDWNTLRTHKITLTNYCTTTDEVYLHITAQASAKDASVAKKYNNYITAVYYAEP